MAVTNNGGGTIVLTEGVELGEGGDWIDKTNPGFARVLAEISSEGELARKEIKYPPTITKGELKIFKEMVGRRNLLLKGQRIEVVENNDKSVMVKRVDVPEGKEKEEEEKTTPAAAATVVKSVKFTKSSIVPNPSCPGNPQVGDIVKLDVVFERWSVESRSQGRGGGGGSSGGGGGFQAANLMVTEIKRVERASSLTSSSPPQTDNFRVNPVGTEGEGFILDVNVNRHFGFITVAGSGGGESGSKLFFHLTSVVYEIVTTVEETTTTEDPPPPPTSSPGGKYVNGLFIPNTNNAPSAALKRGDEVKFQFAADDRRGGGGGGSTEGTKLVAISVRKVPVGTVKRSSGRGREVDVSKMCTGYLLMEPSHTSLNNTPTRGEGGGVEWGEER